MSNEQEQNTTENVDQNTTVDKSENTVPSYRLKEEADKRRTAETKLAEYEKREQEQKDKDLSFEQKFSKLQNEFDSYKEDVAKGSLKDEFTGQLIELGFPRKIAKLADTSSLTEDNIKDHVKSFAKEMKEFMPVYDDTLESTPTTPAALIQPSSTESKQKFDGTITGKDVMNDLIKRNK